MINSSFELTDTAGAPPGRGGEPLVYAMLRDRLEEALECPDADGFRLTLRDAERDGATSSR